MSGAELWGAVELYVQRAAYAVFRNAADADDAIQDAAVLCLGLPSRYPDQAVNRPTELVRIAKSATQNHMKDEFRRRERWARVSRRYLGSLPAYEPSTVDRVILAEEVARVAE